MIPLRFGPIPLTCADASGSLLDQGEGVLVTPRQFVRACRYPVTFRRDVFICAAGDTLVAAGRCRYQLFELMLAISVCGFANLKTVPARETTGSNGADATVAG